MRKKRSRPPVIDLILDVTRVLPNDSWLQRLSVTGEQVQLQGQAKEAASLIPILQRSTLIEGPALQGAILRIDRLMGDLDAVLELDLNPIVTRGPGQGVIAIDARIRRNSSFSDIMILILLWLQLILGLATIPISMQHLDGHEMVKFMNWAQGIFTFRNGAADHISDVHIIFKLHLFLGLTILLLFPFTRLVHMLSAPVRYLWRGGYQIVRSRQSLGHG